MVRCALLLAVALLAGACDRFASPGGGAAALASARADEAAGVRFLEIVTGGASASDTLPLVVAVHGLGGAPEHFLARADLASLPARARIVAPYGTERMGMGFGWFPADTHDLSGDMRRAADRLAAMIAELVQRRPTAGRPIVTGFSQGGMLSYAIAVLHPEAVRAALPASGFLPERLWPSAWPEGRDKPRIRAFHGDADQVVPMGLDRATVEGLGRIGVRVDLHEYHGEGHTLSDDVVRDLQDALTEELRR